MSYTEIYKFKKNGDAVSFAEIKNAFRGAMAVWDILDKKYLPPFKPSWAFSTEQKYSRSIDREGAKEIWALHESDKVSETDKIVLGSTFDKVVVLRENIPELIKAFREFEGETSLKEQADLIEMEFNKDKKMLGIAWNQTSVNGDNWENFGGYNRNDNAIPYNILTMTDHWSLFEKEPAEK